MSLKSQFIRLSEKYFALHLFLLTIHLMRQRQSDAIKVFADALVMLFRNQLWRTHLRVVVFFNFFRELPAVLSLRKKILHLLPGFRNQLQMVSFPANITKNHANRFLKDYYLRHPFRIFHLKEQWIYLTGFLGIVFNNFKIHPASIHGKWDKRNPYLLGSYHAQTMEAWMRAVHSDETALIRLIDSRQYLLVHHWFNYFHWLTETLPRLWQVREKLNGYVVVLPENLRTVEFVQLTLKALGVKNLLYLKEGAVVRVKNLTLVENKPYCNHYDAAMMRKIGQFFVNHVKNADINIPDFGTKIFISRKKAARRKLTNEAEAETLLAGFGFHPLTVEDFSFFEQVKILSSVTHLIGMHGAGLTNMLFMPQGGKVLELHRELHSKNDLHSDVYWKLADALGHDYYYQFCEAADKNEDFFTVNYTVDLELLKKNVEQMVNTPIVLSTVS